MKADNAGLCVIGGEHEDDEIDKDVPPEAT